MQTPMHPHPGALPFGPRARTTPVEGIARGRHAGCARVHPPRRTAADHQTKQLLLSEIRAVALGSIAPVGESLQAMSRSRSIAVTRAGARSSVASRAMTIPGDRGARWDSSYTSAARPMRIFDRSSLILQLSAAMTHPDPHSAARGYCGWGPCSSTNPTHAQPRADFRPQLEAGAQDPDALVKVRALAAMLRGDPPRPDRDAILNAPERPTRHVRRVVVSWLGSPRTEITNGRRARAGAQGTRIRRSARPPPKPVSNGVRGNEIGRSNCGSSGRRGSMRKSA